MKGRRLVSVIVLNYNGKDMTIEFLKSLKKTKFNDYETILVDNGSVDGCVEYVREHFPYVKIIKNKENLGYAGGMNVGINASKSKYVVLMNNDMIVYPEWLGELVKVAQSNDSIGVVVPMLMGYDKESPRIGSLGYVEDSSLILKFRPLARGEPDKGQYKEPVEIAHGNGLIKREVFDKIGLLDEKFFVYWEETDFCYRARKVGYKIVVAPKSKVWHKGYGTLNQKSYKVIYHKHKNKVRFIMRNMRGFRKLFNLAVTVSVYIGEVFYSIFTKDFARAKAVTNSIIWNIKNWKDYI